MKYKPTIKHAKRKYAMDKALCGAPMANPMREGSVNWAFVTCAECRDLKRPDGDETRFWLKVKKNSGDRCWEWTAALRKEGYGNFWLKRRNVDAHRFSYELANGPVPKGAFICHHCDNPRCVRPDHLFQGTPKDNAQDMLKKDRKRGAVKLSVAMVKMIKRRLASGECHKAIAAGMGVSENIVYFIKQGRTWTAIT
jgi:hypothetical protein